MVVSPLGKSRLWRAPGTVHRRRGRRTSPELRRLANRFLLAVFIHRGA